MNLLSYTNPNISEELVRMDLKVPAEIENINEHVNLINCILDDLLRLSQKYYIPSEFRIESIKSVKDFLKEHYSLHKVKAINDEQVMRFLNKIESGIYNGITIGEIINLINTSGYYIEPTKLPILTEDNSMISYKDLNLETLDKNNSASHIESGSIDGIMGLIYELPIPFKLSNDTIDIFKYTQRIYRGVYIPIGLGAHFGVSLIHEIGHSQMDTVRYSYNNYLNSELFSYYLQLQYALDKDASHNFCTSNIYLLGNTMYYLMLDMMTKGQTLEIATYYQSILLSLGLFDDYYQENSQERRLMDKDFQKVIDGDKTIEDIIEEHDLNINSNKIKKKVKKLFATTDIK